MPHVTLAHRIAEAVWRQHFRIPEPAYWVGLVVSAVGFSAEATLEALAWSGVFLLSVIGILRWHWHRRRSRALVVARFSAVAGQEGMAVRVQDLVMTSLQDKLPPDLVRLVHPVPAVVGSADRSYAATLRSRLRSLYVTHGRVDQRADGGWAVFARVVQPTDRSVLHWDWFTRDITPARARWAELFERLTPSREVVAEEYPLEFATELEAVVRGLAGQVAAFFENDQVAEELLRAALDTAPTSTSHQIDQLRIALARVLSRTDRRGEARDLLRERAAGEDPSPALLREIHALQRFGATEGLDAAAAKEAIAALRRAAEHESDPQRDMTLYNLALMLSNHGGDSGNREADTILAELMRTSAFYRRTWYTSFKRGATLYERALAARDVGEGDNARHLFKQAARLYSRGIRARPRVRFLWHDGPRVWIIKRFERSPIMYANAKDAHDGAGHTRRAKWYERRYQRLRSRMLGKAYKHFDNRNWAGAYAYFDWPVVGRWDATEVAARTMRAVTNQQLGNHEEPEADWSETVEREPSALLLRSGLATEVVPPLEAGVPGNEPTDLPTVMARLNEAGVGA